MGEMPLERLFAFGNAFVLPFWALLILAPRWKEEGEAFHAVAADMGHEVPRRSVEAMPGAGDAIFIADSYGGEMVRKGEAALLAPARRKATTLRIARTAVQRLHALMDPDFSGGVRY